MQTIQTVFNRHLGVSFANYAMGIKRLAAVMPVLLIACLWLFGPVSPASAETLCAAGTYSDSGMAPCTPCPAGRFTAGTGSISCSPCPIGQFAANTGSPSCTLCPVNTFAGTVGSEACAPCPPGYSAPPGTAVCSISTQSCPPGKYSATGNEPCTDCAAGTFSASAGSTSCSSCPLDTFTSFAGQTACLACPSGTTTTQVGSTVCTPLPQSCPPGKYSANGKEPCTECPVGAFASNAGSNACTQCPAGTFASTTGSMSCTACPQNTFTSLAGQAACQLCPTGTTAPVGSTACTPLSSDTDGDGVPNNQDDCPNSNLSPTVVIAGCNTGVTKAVFSNGCTISDRVAACAKNAKNHGQFVSCVALLTNDLNKAGTITGQQKGAIQSCAAQANIP